MKIKATFMEIQGKPRIVVKWDYTPDFESIIGRLKFHCDGPRFSKAEKFWTMPATVSNCHGLRKAFGDDLKIAGPLRDWYVEHSVEASEAEAGTAATDAELSIVPTAAPTLSAALRPDQRAGVAYVATGYRGSALVADKPGLGKTIQVIGGIVEADLKGDILIVAPKISVKDVWWREFQKWAKDEVVIAAQGTRAKREDAISEFMDADYVNGRKFLVINADMLRVKRKPNETTVKANAKKRGRVEGYEYPDLFESFVWSAVIVDESHMLLGSLTVAKSNLKGEGLASLPLTADARKIAMSGTPFGKGGRVQGMFGTLHWLWSDEYTSFWRWAERYFEIEEQYVRRNQTAKKIVGLREGMGEEEFMRSLGPRILRRTKEEVLPNLPPKQYIEVACTMDAKQRRQYMQLGDDAEVSVPGGVIIANGVLAEITRARQIANGCVAKRGDKVVFEGESCKADMLFQNLEERGILDGSSDTKVIVSSRYNEFLEYIMKRLDEREVKYHLLRGSTSDAERSRQMEEFQAEGGPQIFILNSKAGGVSITLDAADEVHCLDELDNPEENEQLEDRAHRASRIHQVTIYYYRTVGTYDLNVANSVEDKRQAQFEVLDGRRGIQDVRSWIKFDKEAS